MDPSDRYVRIAEIEIDPAHREKFESAIRDEIEAAVYVEPGVLALYAVADTTNPARIVVFEIYADLEAYQRHLETAHFKAYKTATEGIVRSLRLTDTTPIALGAKAKG
jgi:quinol monooxygenase YgiN